MSYKPGTDGYKYLDKSKGITPHTGYRSGYNHPRGPLNGFGANSCSGTWSSALIYLGEMYRLASGNKVHTLGWGSGHMQCGGFDSGKTKVTANCKLSESRTLAQLKPLRQCGNILAVI
jgi:hypothetical protein